ncbi:MAG TPA: S8 family serine peptidase [Streptosporangiaceae bacterium]|nr:S8 family serine peptidase [Streptosporangiaceae bacterium]
MKVTRGSRGWRPALTVLHAGRARRAVAAIAGLLAAGGMVAAAAPTPAAAAPHGTAPGAVSASTRLARATMASTAVVPAAARPAARLRAACPAARAGHMRCYTLFRPQYAVNQALMRGAVTHPEGWGARTLERAYRLPVSRRSHQTIAVSIFGRTPKLARYLKIYREHYGLPPCGTASGCLRIVNQHGKASPPAPNATGSGWDLEVTLDVSMISAACPHCKIIVVESSNLSDNSLGQTDNTAARLGAQVISNSYGQRENGQAMEFRRDYLHHGHMTVVSSGDSGYDAAQFPANLAGVTAVGGTQLRRAPGSRGFTEQVWNDPSLFAAGSSGCSAYVGKPGWQHDAHCPGRTVADISAIAADVPIFNAAWGGWITVAGTSAAAPFIAGVYGLAGNARHITPRHLYTHRGDFFDITHGNNALLGTPMATCGRDYLCVARKGYDAPTGLGTPDGTSGF